MEENGSGQLKIGFIEKVLQQKVLLVSISITPLFWLFAFLIGWLNSFSMAGTLIWVGVILVSILVHELGHAWTSLAFGQKSRIQLLPFGGVTMRLGRKLKTWQEFLVILAGPLAGYTLGAFCFLLPPVANPWLKEAIRISILVNLFWSTVNLLPITPLDGGKLSGIVLEKIFGFRGIKINLWVSVIIGSMAALGFFVLGALFGGIIFGLLTYESVRALQAMKKMSSQDTNMDLHRLYARAESLEDSGEKEKAYQLFSDVKKQSGSGVLFIASIEKMAKIKIEEGNERAAFQLLIPYRKVLSTEALAELQALGFKLQEYVVALDIASEIYQVMPKEAIAKYAALSAHHLGKTEAAQGWLNAYLELGGKWTNDLQKAFQPNLIDTNRS